MKFLLFLRNRSLYWVFFRMTSRIFSKIKNSLIHLLKIDLEWRSINHPHSIGSVEDRVSALSLPIDFLLVNEIKVNLVYGLGYKTSSTGRDVLVRESSAWDPIYAHLNVGRVPKGYQSKVELLSNVFVIPFVKNYYHWLLDELPLVLAVSQVDKKLNFVSGFRLNSFQLESLPQDTPLHYYNIEWAKVNRVWLPSARFEPGFPSVNEISILRNHFLQTKQPSMTSKRIYISRKKSSRSPKNELMIEEILKEFGFDIIVSEELSFSDQVSIFSEAEVILGPHGAGLANLVFSSSRARLIELVPPHFYNPCYQYLCDLIGISYKALEYSDFDSREKVLSFLGAENL